MQKFLEQELRVQQHSSKRQAQAGAGTGRVSQFESAGSKAVNTAGRSRVDRQAEVGNDIGRCSSRVRQAGSDWRKRDGQTSRVNRVINKSGTGLADPQS